MFRILDSWAEIFESLKKNLLRTILTGFAVGWGIFLLILLLGMSEGLQNGITEQFLDDEINSIWVRGGVTEKPHRGLEPGRKINLTDKEYGHISKNTDKMNKISGRYFRWNIIMSYKTKSGSYRLRAVHPDYQFIENQQMHMGRYLNQSDIAQRRKVAVIGDKIRKDLFGEDVNPVGKYVQIQNIMFRIVGVYKDVGGDNNELYVDAPINICQQVFGEEDKIQNKMHNIMYSFKVETMEESRELAKNTEAYLRENYKVHPDDKRAFSVRNLLENFKEVMGVLSGMKLFIWVIGIGTIISGMAGISNIMAISVKERTKEIGIRKALGATPRNIILMVLQESIFITSIFGYAGLVFALLILELAGANISFEMFKNPEVNIYIALYALAILVISGTLAGYFPARKAARVLPITALKDE